MTSAILLMAGNSQRFMSEKNKLLHSVEGDLVGRKTFDVFNNSKHIDKIVIVRKSGDAEMENIFKHQEKVTFADGGNTRFLSVLSGLRSLGNDSDIVVIHDGARPFVNDKIILDSIVSAKKFGSGIASIKVVDTLRMCDGENLLEVVDRDSVVRIQTPQTFVLENIVTAYEKAILEYGDSANFTDDSLVYSEYIGTPKYIEGSDKNKKITYLNDIENTILTGIGYDIHQLVEGRPLFLCGLEVPHSKGLLGHSDGDAPIHAVMDSILSSLGKRDIGHYFPDTDESFSGIDSKVLLGRVMEIVSEEGYRIGNLSVSIIAEQPKLSPYIEDMKKVLGGILDIPNNKIGITVTTNEGMGLIGEGCAIGAFATVSVYR